MSVVNTLHVTRTLQGFFQISPIPLLEIMYHRGFA